jgi:hypothetical protein
MDPANQNSKALITNMKSPKVKIVIGKVRIIKIGLIKAFSNPRMAAPMMAAPRLSTLIPGIKYAATSIARVIIIQARRMLMTPSPPKPQRFFLKITVKILQDDYITKNDVKDEHHMCPVRIDT